MNELTGFQRDLLYCIAAIEDPYGLNIKRELEEYLSIEVNHGRLYPNLDQLVEKGLLSKEQKDKRTNLYPLTPSAEDLIADRRQWEDEILQASNINLH